MLGRVVSQAKIEALADQYIRRAFENFGETETLSHPKFPWFGPWYHEAFGLWMEPADVVSMADLGLIDDELHSGFSTEDAEWSELDTRYYRALHERRVAFQPIWHAAVNRAVLAAKRDTFISQGMDFEAAEVAAALTMSQ